MIRAIAACFVMLIAIGLCVVAVRSHSSPLAIVSSALCGAVLGYLNGLSDGAKLEAERAAKPVPTLFGGEV